MKPSPIFNRIITACLLTFAACIISAKTHAQTDSLVTFTTWTDSSRYFQEFSAVFGELAGDDTVYISGIGADSVVGVNDGFDSSGNMYYVSWTDGNVHINGSDAIMPGLLTNDILADSFANLTVLHGAGALNIKQGTSSTIVYYTPAAGEGGQLILLSYVPYNESSGKQGNVTFIFLLVSRDPSCSPTNCDLMVNGDIINVTNCGSYVSTYNSPTVTASVCDWYSLLGTPELFSAGCGVTPTYSIDGPFTVPWIETACTSSVPVYPSNYPTTNSFLGIGSGYGYAGCSPAWEWEGIWTQLSAPLITGGQYILSFDARVSVDAIPYNHYHDVYLQIYVSTGRAPSTTDFFYCVPPLLPSMTTLLDPATATGGYSVEAIMPCTSNSWTPTSHSFTYTGPVAAPGTTQFISIVVNPTLTATNDGFMTDSYSPSIGNYQDYIYIDNIHLTPVMQTPTVTPNPVCSGETFTMSPNP